ncbi:MAG: DUF3014 domain-containing protein [Acidobacteria bacterium]|nr:MAG: DUF3014 domain-containing protein [Acidobacteriota bacterium]
MPYDDLPLGRPSSPPPALPSPPRSSPVTRWIVAIAAIVAAGGGLYFWWLTRQPTIPSTPPPTAATDVAVGTNRPTRQPIELPALDASDAFFREIVSTLSRHPQLARFLATDGLIRATVLAVEQIGDGKTPAGPLKVLRPTTRLKIMGNESGKIEPAAYVRWEGNVSALTSIRSREAAQLYVNLEPLFDAAYSDLGHPGAHFTDALTRAINMLLSTPEPGEEPVLLKRAGFYEHADASLRALKPVQKQFLLLGPDRRASVRAWLSNFAKGLDLAIK